MPQTSPSVGLEAVIHQGALRRQHFYGHLLRAAWPASAAGVILAASVYIVVMVLAGRTDWHNILIVAAAAAAIPLIAVSLLLMTARRQHPFSMALVVMVFSASLAIAILSALRVPISYIGMFVTLPGSLFFVTLANLAMVRSRRRSVAMLEFPGAEKVASMVPWDIPVIRADDVDMQFRRILIDPAVHHTTEWAPQLAHLYLRGLEIEPWPTYLEGALGKVDLDSFDLGHVSYSPAQILYYRSKRVLDLFGVLVLGLPAALICGLIWTYIRIIDGGPSLFVQDRRGYAGSTFKVYKFRTMYKGDHTGSTVAGDSRIMPGCGLLRQMRLDELPQLFNILRGDMSFIGPRPVAVPVAEALEQRIPLYVNRHILVPGLTGWAQVSQGYATTQDEEIEKLAFDLYYLKHVSMDLDIIIIFRTIRTVLLRFGAR